MSKSLFQQKIWTIAYKKKGEREKSEKGKKRKKKFKKGGTYKE